MAIQLVCDACGETTPDTEQGRASWIGLVMHKIKSPTSVVRSLDLCRSCGERVRKATIFIPDAKGVASD